MRAKALDIFTIMSGQDATGTGATASLVHSGEKSFQAAVTGSGTVTATVKIEVSLDPTNLGWLTLGQIDLSATTTDTGGFVSNGAWSYYRANVRAISGTGAAVTVKSAQE